MLFILVLAPALSLAGPIRLPGFLRKKDPEPVVEAEPVEQAPDELAPARPPTFDHPLFEGTLPLSTGPIPDGFANLSAQGCYACHPAAYQGWQAGPHPQPPSTAMRDAVARSGTTGCFTCHLPLATQHSVVPNWTGDDAKPNTAFDATLHLEGVTCAACHLRDGRIAVATEEAARGVGPHVVALAPDLRSSEGCAACHQLTWPGANMPLYDTFGEWQRSAWAEAGVTCVDCHMSATEPHAWSTDPGRAVSVLIDTPSLRLVRGEGPMKVKITLQNTGAGHSWPTGTPFRGVRLVAGLERPSGGKGAAVSAGAPFEANLARTLDREPPWSTREDTRLAAGESRAFTFDRPISVREPAGTWWLVVKLVPTLYGEPDGAALLERRLPLRVE